MTAGTSSPLTDGAAAVLVRSEDYAAKHGLTMLARIRSRRRRRLRAGHHGHRARSRATRKALARAKLDVSDIDVVELNEAFASQAIACMRELGIPHETAEHRRRRDRARPSAGRHRRAHHRQGRVAAEARRGADMRWPRSASAAARASPPCWSGSDHESRSARSAVIGAGVMGGGIAAQVANAGVPVLLLDIVPQGRPTATRWPQARSRRC